MLLFICIVHLFAVTLNTVLQSPFNFNEMQALECIQRAATRYILHYPDVKYNERCSTLNPLPLSFRRDRADLAFYFKYLHGLQGVQLHGF